MAKNRTKLTAEPGRLDLHIEREFDAPRELVFRAHTDPDLYAQWVGPRGLTTTIDTFEVRNGGSWRFVQKDEQGKEYASHGVYHEVLSPERLIGTFEYEGLPETGHVSLEISKFEELPGNRTRVVDLLVYPSTADRDGMLGSGMEEGMEDSYSRLDELLEKMKVQAHTV